MKFILYFLKTTIFLSLQKNICNDKIKKYNRASIREYFVMPYELQN